MFHNPDAIDNIIGFIACVILLAGGAGMVAWAIDNGQKSQNKGPDNDPPVHE